MEQGSYAELTSRRSAFGGPDSWVHMRVQTQGGEGPCSCVRALQVGWGRVARRCAQTPLYVAGAQQLRVQIVNPPPLFFSKITLLGQKEGQAIGGDIGQTIGGVIGGKVGSLGGAALGGMVGGAIGGPPGFVAGVALTWTGEALGAQHPK